MKKLYIIASSNGAGKTTASYTVLPEILECTEFVNADEIGCSPFVSPSSLFGEGAKTTEDEIGCSSFVSPSSLFGEGAKTTEDEIRCWVHCFWKRTNLDRFRIFE
jgi:hypothetical protein